jgi:1-acyl-sn-glycerol-3-phosphate acyltransferase
MSIPQHERPSLQRESWSRTWSRRAKSIPLIMLAATLALVLLPLTALLAVLVAPFEPRRWAILRCVGFFTTYLVGESIFLTIAFLQWLFAFGDRGRLVGWTHWLSNVWGAILHGSGRVFFGLVADVTGMDAVEAGGPILVFFRHTSIADTPLAPVYIGKHAGLRLRYIAKRELQSDPIFDVIGSRLDTCFVARASKNPAREIDAVCSLLENMGPQDAIVLYPEGTRFSPEKRERIMARLGDQLDPVRLQRARRLRHLLPPRLGGPVALLERNPGADIVFCTHIGYEGAATFADLLHGRAIGRRIQVEFRRVPFAEVPTEREAIVDWLFAQWAQLDNWIDERMPRTPADRKVARA